MSEGNSFSDIIQEDFSPVKKEGDIFIDGRTLLGLPRGTSRAIYLEEIYYPRRANHTRDGAASSSFNRTHKISAGAEV